MNDEPIISGTKTRAGVKLTKGGKPYDLSERTAIFGEEVIDFLKKVPVTKITGRLIDQLSGAGTSIGANYCEADDAPSKKAYRSSISTCKREARETKFFIRMIVRAVPELSDDAKPLWQEAKELHLIFCKLHKGSGQE
jgi:four helix bundle protein